RLHEAWVDQKNPTSSGEKAPAPIVRAPASFHRDRCWRQFLDHPDQLRGPGLARVPLLSMPWMWNECLPRSIASKPIDIFSPFDQPQWSQKAGGVSKSQWRAFLATASG